MGLPLFVLPSRRRHASGVRGLPMGRCRAERSICRGFGSAGCGGSFCACLTGHCSAGTWRRSQTPSGLGRPAARGAVPRAGSPGGRCQRARHGRGAVVLLRTELGEGSRGFIARSLAPCKEEPSATPSCIKTAQASSPWPPEAPQPLQHQAVGRWLPGKTCWVPAHRGEVAASASST